jgi:hypothetical protein
MKRTMAPGLVNESLMSPAWNLGWAGRTSCEIDHILRKTVPGIPGGIGSRQISQEF